MDVLFEYGSTRNGLDTNFYSFLGIGEGQKKIGKWRSAQAKELADNNPYANNVDDQSALVQKHEAILEGLKQERARAKSKKTKNSLDARIQAYGEFISDARYHLTSLIKESVKSETPTPIILTGGGVQYDVQPAPIVTSQGGEVVLPTKQVYVQEQPAQTTQDISLTRTGDVANEGLTQPTQPTQGKKDNRLLYVGLGVGAILLIILTRK
jgi:DNA-nicking Smr family endonuclease